MRMHLSRAILGIYFTSSTSTHDTAFIGNKKCPSLMSFTSRRKVKIDKFNAKRKALNMNKIYFNKIQRNEKIKKKKILKIEICCLFKNAIFIFYSHAPSKKLYRHARENAKAYLKST